MAEVAWRLCRRGWRGGGSVGMGEFGRRGGVRAFFLSSFLSFLNVYGSEEGRGA